MPVEDFQDECSFCAEMSGEQSHNLFHQLYGNGIGDRYILARSRSFVVMPAMGSFVDGYLLIVPLEHYPSMGHLTTAELDELEEVMATVSTIVGQQYSLPIFFEHGAMSFTLRGACCTDHAHLHVVPVPFDTSLGAIMAQRGIFTVQQLSRLHDLQKYVERRMPYLFLKSLAGTMWARESPNAMSQYFRHHIATMLNLGDRWDWRSYPGQDEILRTINVLGPQFVRAFL